MRHTWMSSAALTERVWRATAIGFSVTAVALIALPAALDWRTERQSTPSSAAGSARQPPLEESAAEAAHPDPASAPNADALPDHATLFDLARRFSDAADAELSELATALASLGGQAAHQVLFSAARSSRASCRAAALEALATIDTADVREFMVEQLNTPDPAPAAVAYFADCHEPRALPALERLARDAPLSLRSALIVSLFAQGADAEPAIFRLLRGDTQLSDALLETPPTTAAARRALRRESVQRVQAGAITEGRVFDFLEQDLSAEARDALVLAAHDPGSVARALTALSNRGDRASLRALERLSREPDRDLAARASCALRFETASHGSRVRRGFAM
ncbi:MAG: hypothetical protein ABW061_26950 [Polyangiaceae bacterium]